MTATAAPASAPLARADIGGQPRRAPSVTGPTEPFPAVPAVIPPAARPEVETPLVRPPPDARLAGNADQPVPTPRNEPLVTLHPAGPDDGKALSAQLALQAGLAPGQIDTGEGSEPRPRALIRFYSAEDHGLARRLGAALAHMGYSWQIESRAGRPSSPEHQAVEVWLPKR